MKFPLFLILLLIVIIFICGCTQTTSDNKPGLATDIPLTPVTTAATVTLPPATISAPPKDPIIGTWIFHIYASWGKVDDEFIFLENNTWTRIITDVKSNTKKYTHATWIKNSAKNYTVGSHIFEYNITSDELTDLTQTALAGFEFIYHRTAAADSIMPPLPTMNITVFDAQMVSELNGARPYSGHTFLVVNISIKNINENGWYSFTDNHIWASYEDGGGSNSINDKNAGKLENPFPSAKIVPGEVRQGNVIFGVPEKSKSFTLKLIDVNGNAVSNIIELNNVRTYATYSTNPD